MVIVAHKHSKSVTSKNTNNARGGVSNSRYIYNPGNPANLRMDDEEEQEDERKRKGKKRREREGGTH